jgi:hypothetical protein
MIYGLDTLGLARFSDEAIRAIPVGIPVSAFALTFGEASKNVRKACKLRKPSHVKIQMLWDDAHDFGDSDIPMLKTIAENYERIAKEFPKIVFYLSPFCEHRLSNPDKYLDIVARHAPSCIPLNTPWTGKLSRKYLNEVHGSHEAPAGKYLYSNDGTNSVDANITSDKRQHRRAEIFWFWHPAFNGRKNSADPTPRPERRAWPTPDLIKSVWYLRRDKGKTSLTGNRLWKSHADRHETPPEPRAYKPVVIISEEVPELTLHRGKKLIAKLKYYAPFADGRHRYYAKEFGYKLSIKAGHRTCTLKAGSKVIGTVNPAFREGDYRE